MQRSDDSGFLSASYTKYTVPSQHTKPESPRLTAAMPGLKLRPLDMSASLRRLATDAIRGAITEMDIYGHQAAIRLDERQLGQELGVSRTPIREALGFLEQEGLVRSIPRRGVFVVRKTKAEIVEMTMVWAAIESMAARLAATRATDAQIAALHALFADHERDPAANLHEYSQANMEFHKAIIRLGGNALMTTMTDTIFIHMRAVRAVTMTQENRARRGMADHLAIMDALAARDPDAAARLVREHTMGLAAHIEAHGGLLDDPARIAQPL